MRSVIGGSNTKYFIYGFFLIHMLGFGGSGFFMAYADSKPDLSFLYMHGGFAIFVYLVFYLMLFGLDEVKWIFINAALGFFGILTEIGWILSLFGKQVSDFPYKVHVIPFLYYILYTFLIRRALLDFSGAQDTPKRKTVVETAYVLLSTILYTTFYFLG